MKRFIFGFILGFLLACEFVNAEVKQQETIVDASPESLVTLNEQLRQIRETVKDHEQRLVAGGL